MAQVVKQIQNNFIAGLKTEYTALNFPDNAATDCSNIEFSLIGDISRRGGIDFEANGTITGASLNGAINSYKWNNVGGDGSTQIVAVQVGRFISFFVSSSATITNPLSSQGLSSQVDLNTFVASGGTLDNTLECQFTDGNGYLFIFHPNCDPIYCTYNAGTITAKVITVQIRDFAGLPDNLSPTTRPPSLSQEHLYNLINQGWSSSQTAWNSSSLSPNTVPSNTSTVLQWTIGTGLPVHALTDVVAIQAKLITGPRANQYVTIMSGVVQTYASGSGVITILCSNVDGTFSGQSFSDWLFGSATQDLIGQFNTAAKGFPSNSDVWWLYKNSSGLFSPTSLLGSVTISGPAPQGSVILNAFNQVRNGVTTSTGTVSGTTDVKTTVRPRTGTWFQGRVFYSGVDGSQQATGDAPYTTWTENIYFSQIVQQTQDFGLCYQTNDPTSETTFDLLPTDGGVIVIQGSGPIYKLFPVQNGLLVFAANGIWFITGSTGIGFTANDYTVTKITGIKTISGTSFVNVLGWPYFWNEEGIYTLTPTKQGGGGLEVENLTLGNILSFYQNIPTASKLYVRGDYDPINYQLQWVFKKVPETGINDRYRYDSILVHNTVELPRERGAQLGKVFYPYSISTGASTIAGIFPSISGVRFVQNPTSSATTPASVFKYLTFGSGVGFTFSEENNFTTYTDWKSFDGTGKDAAAHVITGYNLKPQHHPYYQYYAQALVKHSVSYINVFIRNTSNNSYLFNSIWDWAIDSSSGKFSSQQQVTNNLTSGKFAFLTRRHRVRGRGYSLQFQFKSVPGQPMDIIGWSVFEHISEAP